MTKLAALATILLTATSATAFSSSRPGAVQQKSLQSSTSLNLFGSKPKDPSAEGGQPGMMDQLAMFKKAQELAQKKAALDKELAEEKIVGTAADGKIEITIKYVPPQLPVNPTPGYEASDVNIDEEYLGEVSAEDLSAALVDAIRDGEKTATEKVAEKYATLQEDMMKIMGGAE
mmetsp:Transcript_18170/g.39104  ORF Transcript_18170/g.39104 Transcript_18170/m.39104 type:complete len:174 (+) Transcript_18170:299-820(+)|eukprot:CAMPEP_0172549450 /NCGR_PEP_ID=MMETSP1067-20121228/18537_1 /TAXON_ID=265564 ORGANISM="Thalassiosira punctigera, Strain Tpunct2005C2" /NCGR_SAMPLE_ID=MMETSP1067 /ASSEMBLY_ACC=CAM_ASM_000444 /LENGTH=173 /DNA_ID=CAMNT_0013336841 /DNA_START=299 /DNA_END=820 /DNA_ORIENTATION=-